MPTRRISEAILLPVVVALLAAACGDARSIKGAQTTTCTSCHDQPPPTGAHLEHVLGAGLGAPVACDECHVVPATLQTPGHLDPPVKIAFGSLAATGGLTPSYDPSTQTCSNVYCHGNFAFSRATPPPPAPSWSQGEAAVACGTCHDIPPPAPLHVSVDIATQGCGTSTNPALTCHPPPYTPTSVDATLHIDGRICPPFCTPATP